MLLFPLISDEHVTLHTMDGDVLLSVDHLIPALIQILPLPLIELQLQWKAVDGVF